MHFKNDAFLVLQPRDLRAGDEGAARPRRSISTGDVARVTQMGCGSNKIYSRHPERANADAAQAQPIRATFEDQGAAATPDTDNEAGFHNMQAHRAEWRD
jgi:hypothetical protein